MLKGDALKNERFMGESKDRERSLCRYQRGKADLSWGKINSQSNQSKITRKKTKL